MPSAPGEAVLASDLDGTVVGINTFPAFVRFLVRHLRTTRQVGPLVRLLVTGALRRAHLVGHKRLKRVVCVVGQRVPEEDLRRWAGSVLSEHGHAEVIRLIGEWPGRAVLTTAAPELYAVHVAALLGIPEVHGTVLRDGRLVNNESHAKCVRLRAAGHERVAVFLTDDLVLDGPLAGLADRVYEVLDGGGLREWVPGSPRLVG